MSSKLSITTRMEKARTSLLLDHPFFGSLLFRLKGQESRSVTTMATDGVSLYYNPDFVDTLTAATLAGVLAHEVMHPALAHHTRRSGRSPKRWNEACDYAINPLLFDAGLQLPSGVLVNDSYRGLSAEEIYNRLLADEQASGTAVDDESEGSPDQTEPAPTQAGGSAPESEGGIGQVLDAPPQEDSPTGMQSPERDWIIAVNQAAAIASRAGKLPADLKRSLQGAAAARVDWRELLRQAWSEATPSDYAWTRPNRRYIWSGTYLPGLQKEGVGEVAIAIDCSGSVNERQLRLFEAEVRSIVEGRRPQAVHLLYFDTRVHHHELVGPGEQIQLTPVGGGGTDFRPCFDWLEDHQIVPETLVFLTDLCGRFPPSAPAYPVIWASTVERQAPFGLVVPMQDV